MTIGEALKLAGIDRIDAEILLADILGQSRTSILAHPEKSVLSDQWQQFSAYCKRRRNAEPVAYILGRAPFYGREFFLTSDCLIPRPATEGLIESIRAFLEQPKNTCTAIDTEIIAISQTLRNTPAVTIIDVGTGSGCIAITLALEHPKLSIIASDISSAALAVARKNAKHHEVEHRIQFQQGDLLSIELPQTPFLVVSNPPYIPEALQYSLSPSVVNFEPHQALFAGKEGTDIIEDLCMQAKNNTHCVGIILECREDQKNLVHQCCSLAR